MDEKHQHLPQPINMNPPRRVSTIFAKGRQLLLIAVVLIVSFHLVAVPFMPKSFFECDHESMTKALVPFEAHIISKCPDTKVWNNYLEIYSSLLLADHLS